MTNLLPEGFGLFFIDEPGEENPEKQCFKHHVECFAVCLACEIEKGGIQGYKQQEDRQQQRGDPVFEGPEQEIEECKDEDQRCGF